MDIEMQMGDVTQVAYNCIREDVLACNNRLDPVDVLDFLQDSDNFKSLPDLLKDTMLKAGLPRETAAVLRKYPSLESFHKLLRAENEDLSLLQETDPPQVFSNVLFSLLSEQDNECLFYKRNKPWRAQTISRWFGVYKTTSLTGKAESVRSRDDAIAICFALGLSYEDARTFMNKSGHMAFNIRDAEDAVYIYCLLNQRPYAAAKKLIKDYYEESKNAKELSVGSDQGEYHSSGQTTLLLLEEILGDSDWKSDDAFFSTFLMPNRQKFTSFSRTALREYYRLKNPIYLAALKELLEAEHDQYNDRIIQKHILKSNSDKENWPVTIPRSAVQVTLNFINKIPVFSGRSELFREAEDMLTIRVRRLNQRSDTNKAEDFKPENNTLEVMDFISRNYDRFADRDQDLEAISDFLSVVMTAPRMLSVWIPSLMDDEKEGLPYLEIKEKRYYIHDFHGQKYLIDKESEEVYHLSREQYQEIEKTFELKHVDKRQLAYSSSSLKDSVLDSFPHRTFFTQYEKDPKDFVHHLSIRKAIILLYYLNYARDLLLPLRDSDSTYFSEIRFDIDGFMEVLDTLLVKCQLGTLYPANRFDWLILQSVRQIELAKESYDSVPSGFIHTDFIPISLLNSVIEESINEYDESIYESAVDLPAGFLGL